ncbi:MAG: ABC transporter ATP-binding protein [Anaerolineae bacterium]|nr:ABC transporter ATP-binding protein [Anaerolineae bacterium]
MKVILHNISKTFNGREAPLPALAPVTLHIKPGEFICFLGPSGCGKSTLLRLIADQIEPTTGQIVLDGDTPTSTRQQKAIAWMAQNPALLPWQTVLENVRLPLQINRQHQRPAPTPHELLDMMGLMDFASAYPGTLSGGMQQRVALARTLTTGAPLWLMDEPFAALDALTRETLTGEVLHLWKKFHPTVLWVTHDITEAVHLADRIVVMTARPGHIRGIVTLSQPRPRDETTMEIAQKIREVRHLLRNREQPVTGEPT